MLQKGVIKVLSPICLSETKGGVSGAPNLATPPLTLELREVVDLLPKGGGLATQPQVLSLRPSLNRIPPKGGVILTSCLHVGEGTAAFRPEKGRGAKQPQKKDCQIHKWHFPLGSSERGFDNLFCFSFHFAFSFKGGPPSCSEAPPSFG